MTIKYLDSKRISSDQYKVHSFTSNGTFAVTGSGDVEVLVIGAGGGGSADNYGGGGAGGMSEKSGHAVTAQSYGVTVGTGGAGGVQSGGSVKGSNGNISSFDSIVSNAGGAGGINSSSGNDGGSGGGCGTTTNAQTGGNTTQGDTNGATGYGFDGGDLNSSGGGGAGQVGQTPNGGNGRANSISGISVYYAGGGGSVDGTGGTGGGGNGNAWNSGSPSHGTANTGSGGGSGHATTNGTAGNGGSGIVIIRYLDDGSITATGGTITTVTDIKPTNIQDNSILVEKDTGRRYWRTPEVSGADTTTTNSNVNDVAHFEGANSANTVIGEQITSGNALIGQAITSLSFWLYKLNSGSSGTETFTFGVWNSSGANVHEFGTVTRGELPQGTAFGNAVKFTKSTGSYVLQTNDILGIRTNSAPASAWTVEVTQRDTDVYSNGQRALFVQGVTPTTSAKDIGFEVVSNTVTPATWTGNIADLSGCIAYYNFEQTSGNLINQATTASGFTDGLGTALVGTNSGATQTATGKIGNAWDFDGTNDYVSTSTNASIPIGTEPVSFNIWVNPDTFTSYHTMFSLGTGASNQALYITNDGNANDGGVEVHRYNGAVVTSGSTNMILNAWNMVTFTYDGSNVKLYLDGAQVGTATHSFGTNDTGIRIGKNTHGGEFWGGRLDEFSVWTRVLTPAEITTLYNSGRGKAVY